MSHHRHAEPATFGDLNRLNDATFQSVSDGIAIVAVLVAALPWAVLAQPLRPPSHFAPETVFIFAAASSGMALMVAMVCQGFKVGALIGDVMVVYLLKDHGRIFLMFVELCLQIAAFSFCMTVAGYAFKTGLFFAVATGLGAVSTLVNMVQYPWKDYDPPLGTTDVIHYPGAQKEEDWAPAGEADAGPTLREVTESA